jgi:hypothetical protein
MSEAVATVEAVHHSETQPRGERGRFAERPRTVKQQSARLQATFIHTLTEDDVEAIARKLIEQARNGDNTSARLVLKHGFGQLMSHFETDWALEREAKEAAKAPRSPSVAPPTAPTAEQVMAAIHDKMRAQQALEADILSMGLGGGGKKPGGGKVAGAPVAGPGKGAPAAGAGR